MFQRFLSTNGSLALHNRLRTAVSLRTYYFDLVSCLLSLILAAVAVHVFYDLNAARECSRSEVWTLYHKFEFDSERK